MTYLVDASAFVTAHRGPYAVELCPGFWKSVGHHIESGEIRSIDLVREELLAGDPKDWLLRWAESAPEDMWLQTDDKITRECFIEITSRLRKCGDYSHTSIQRFLKKETDAKLVAYAKAHGFVVVSMEVGKKGKVKIPDLCEDHGIEHIDTYEMLRRLAIQFGWRPPSSGDGEGLNPIRPSPAT